MFNTQLFKIKLSQVFSMMKGRLFLELIVMIIMSLFVNKCKFRDNCIEFE